MISTRENSLVLHICENKAMISSVVTGHLVSAIYIRKFKSLGNVCGCTSRFVLDCVREGGGAALVFYTFSWANFWFNTFNLNFWDFQKKNDFLGVV